MSQCGDFNTHANLIFDITVLMCTLYCVALVVLVILRSFFMRKMSENVYVYNRDFSTEFFYDMRGENLQMCKTCEKQWQMKKQMN